MENMPMGRQEKRQENKQGNTEAILPSRETQDKAERRLDRVKEEQWTPGPEIEYCQYESELHDKKKKCHKNPGHQEFIPALDFTLQHLPEGHRDNLVLDFIQTVIFLTVRVVVSYISKDRPDYYPSSHRRGFNRMSFGSGMVKRVFRMSTEEDGGKCPCRECENFPDKAKAKWAVFHVKTASHVVFDSKECEHSRCDVGFDRDENKDKCDKLDGVNVSTCNIEMDLCEICCVSHNEDVINKMEKMVSQYYDLRYKLDGKYASSEYDDISKVPVFCVSHPHGMAKHITVGVMRGRQKVYPYALNYETGTCFGTSGAPVFALGRWGNGKWKNEFCRHSHHSKSLYTGENQSGDSGW